MKSEQVQLGSVSTIERVTASAADRQSLPYVGLEHIEKDRGTFTRDFPKRPEMLSALNYRFTPAHVLYGKLRPYLNKVALPDFDGVCTTEILPILPHTDALDRGFLYEVLRCPAFVSWATRRVAGANLPRLSPDTLCEYELLLPPLPEQRRIALLLKRADDLRRTREYALELSGTVLPATFVEMFDSGDDHPTFSVGDLADDRPGALRTGPFGSQLLHSEFTDHGIAVLGIDNAVNNRFEWATRRFITTEKFTKLKRYTVHPGDVLITIMGTCGRCAVVPEDIETAINTKHLCCISLDRARCLPKFLHGAFLYHPLVRHQLEVATNGAIMSGLNMEIIRQLRIPLPPLPAQQQYVSLATKYARLVGEQREALRQSEHLLQSLLFREFATQD